MANKRPRREPNIGGKPAESEELLEVRQNKSLRLTGVPIIKTLAQASRFMQNVGIALRYWPSTGIPMASMYRACSGNNGEKEEGQRRAIEITNQLLESFLVIEVNMIAARLCLVASSIVPPLFRLVTRERVYDQLPKLSPGARQRYELLRIRGEITAGDLRKKMGIKSGLQEDPAYIALGELQQHFLVDRGPFKMREKGIPYLSKEGYPYHLFHEAHLELVTASQKLDIKQAALTFLSAFLHGAVFCPVRKMQSMFQLFLSRDEIDEALQVLIDEGKIVLADVGKGKV